MAIKVVIERTAKPGKSAELEKLLVDLRSLALRQPGYLSGETLVSADDTNSYMVVSVWKNQPEWWRWENTPKRKELAAKIGDLLVSAERVRIFTEL